LILSNQKVVEDDEELRDCEVVDNRGKEVCTGPERWVQAQRFIEAFVDQDLVDKGVVLENLVVVAFEMPEADHVRWASVLRLPASLRLGPGRLPHVLELGPGHATKEGRGGRCMYRKGDDWDGWRR
jgi:hypothetical protein